MASVAYGSMPSFARNHDTERADSDDGHPEQSTVILTGTLRSSLLDYQASLKVFLLYIIGIDTAFYILLAIASTCLFHFLPGDSYNTNLSWTFVSFAVIFPITWNIGTAYRRRDTALVALASFKALAICLVTAHRDWSWAPFTSEIQGRQSLPANHLTEVRQVASDLTSHVELFLLLPCVNRSRHLHTAAGALERTRVRVEWKAHLKEIQVNVARLSIANERMKRAGMPANESTRINQYLMLLLDRFNELRFIKGYRTPEGIRSFARVFIFIHPLFYGPYYAYVAANSHLVFALAFSILIGVSMIGLLNVEIALEDPFDQGGLDRIRVSKLFEELRSDLSQDISGSHGALYDGMDLMSLSFKPQSSKPTTHS